MDKVNEIMKLVRSAYEIVATLTPEEKGLLDMEMDKFNDEPK